MPPETLEAFRDHGVARVTLSRDLEQAERDLADLADLGLSLDEATAELLEEGIRKFAEPFDHLLGVVASRARELTHRGG
jgi:transaldolase